MSTPSKFSPLPICADTKSTGKKIPLSAVRGVAWQSFPDESSVDCAPKVD
ncbi:MAG: hypothetical protein R1F52_01135 [Candidatus Nitrosoabyssus spongiisocia]|nr:MAG: hypothetical protein R1F52_01135 [Nitrosopumilaceae archaeon AB1(1)]